jgi:hypothetical protein
MNISNDVPSILSIFIYPFTYNSNLQHETVARMMSLGTSVVSTITRNLDPHMLGLPEHDNARHQQARMKCARQCMSHLKRV